MQLEQDSLCLKRRFKVLIRISEGIFPAQRAYRLANARYPRRQKQSTGLFSSACAPSLFESLQTKKEAAT